MFHFMDAMVISHLYILFLIGELANTVGGSVGIEDMNVTEGAITLANPQKTYCNV